MASVKAFFAFVGYAIVLYITARLALTAIGYIVMGIFMLIAKIFGIKLEDNNA